MLKGIELVIAIVLPILFLISIPLLIFVIKEPTTWKYIGYIIVFITFVGIITTIVLYVYNQLSKNADNIISNSTIGIIIGSLLALSFVCVVVTYSICKYTEKPFYAFVYMFFIAIVYAPIYFILEYSTKQNDVKLEFLKFATIPVAVLGAIAYRYDFTIVSVLLGYLIIIYIVILSVTTFQNISKAFDYINRLIVI